MPPYIFNQHGAWNAVKLRGAVYGVPDSIRNLKVTEFHVQWLSSYDQGDLWSSKNHICFRLLLAQPYYDPNTKNFYYAVMLSMDPNDHATTEHILRGYPEGPVCSTDYEPGMFSLKMLRYDTETFTTAFSRQYPLAQNVTVNHLINPILELGMDEFVFEIYTWRGAKKGCGHFAVRAYEVWLRKNIITDPHSIEVPHITFPEDLLYTYFPDKSRQYVPVARGTFLRNEARAIDENTALVNGDVLWSGAPARSHLIITGWNVDEYYRKREAADNADLKRRQEAAAAQKAKEAENSNTNV